MFWVDFPAENQRNGAVCHHTLLLIINVPVTGAFGARTMRLAVEYVLTPACYAPHGVIMHQSARIETNTVKYYVSQAGVGAAPVGKVQHHEKMMQPNIWFAVTMRAREPVACARFRCCTIFDGRMRAPTTNTTCKQCAYPIHAIF